MEWRDLMELDHTRVTYTDIVADVNKKELDWNKTLYYKYRSLHFKVKSGLFWIVWILSYIISFESQEQIT